MVQVNYTRPNEPEINRDVVAACEDIAQLREWQLEIEIVADEVAEVIKAHSFAGGDTSRAAHKLAFLRIAQTWLRRRLRQLGNETPSPEDEAYADRLKREVVTLHAQNDRLRAQVDAARDVREVHMLATVVHAAGGYVRVAESHAEQATTLVLSRTEEKATGDIVFTTETYEG